MVQPEKKRKAMSYSELLSQQPCDHNCKGVCFGQQAASRTLYIINQISITDKKALVGKTLIESVAQNGPTGRSRRNTCKNPFVCNYYFWTGT